MEPTPISDTVAPAAVAVAVGPDDPEHVAVRWPAIALLIVSVSVEPEVIDTSGSCPRYLGEFSIVRFLRRADSPPNLATCGN
jgi:hypothetical protein